MNTVNAIATGFLLSTVQALGGCASGSDSVEAGQGGASGTAGATSSGGAGGGGGEMATSTASSASSTSVASTGSGGGGNVDWSKRFGGSGSEGGTRVAVDADGNVFLLAWLADDGVAPGSIDFGLGALVGAGGYDVVVAKLGPDGAPLWSKRFGDADEQIGVDLALDAGGNVVVVGELRGSADFGGGPLTSQGLSDVFVAKLDTDGNLVWAKRFGDAMQQGATSVCVGDDGRIVISGSFYGALDFGGGPLEAEALGSFYVAALDAAGGPLYAHRFEPGSFNDASVGLACGPSGRVAWTGRYYGILELGGGFALTSAGFPYDQKHQIFVVSLDASGNPEWGKSFGDEESVFQGGLDVAFDTSGAILATGTFHGAANFGLGSLQSAGGLDTFVAKLGPSGEALYATRLGGATDDVDVAIAVDDAGNAYVTGYVEASVDMMGPLAGKAHVAKIDPTGVLSSSALYGPPTLSMRRGQDIAVGEGGHVFVAGFFEGILALGTTTLTSNGGYDLFLAELLP